ncbi:YdcF family protein [Shouchella sp. JSM 1781072]|uniref:YdcF family protein n=1 Tax=Bacillaceae TaxID=186817 RepID=UPI0020D01346|nr:YdcF family protein [Alkalihalobacillus sp. LMS6]UTR06929.1 YdcF family protein [Alkalihalobacillus sp. LMS6]
MKKMYADITDFVFVESTVEKADILFIPGSDHPPLMEKAAALYHGGFTPYILISGGYKAGLNQTECDYLKQIGDALQIPIGCMLTEPYAQHTYENAHFSRDYVHKENISVKKAIIVCKATHSRRVLLTYQAVFGPGVEFYVVPCVDRFGIERTFREIKKIGMYGKQIIRF